MTFSQALSRFAQTLADGARSAIPSHPEDPLKRPVQKLLEAAGDAWKLEVTTRPESPVADVGGIPDLGVAVSGLLTGHVELKAPGKGARAERLKGADGTQWKKFKSLPNLIYSDGLEWTLYRTGKRVTKTVRLGGDIEDLKDFDPESTETGDLADLIRDFLDWKPIVPSSPKGLAELLAPLCRLLR